MDKCCAETLTGHYGSVSDKIVQKLNISAAEICDSGRIVLKACKNQKIFYAVGYYCREVENVVLYEEEALYYCELGHLKVASESKSFSFAELFSELSVKPHCYFVYSYLRNLGFNLKPFDMTDLILDSNYHQFIDDLDNYSSDSVLSDYLNSSSEKLDTRDQIPENDTRLGCNWWPKLNANETFFTECLFFSEWKSSVSRLKLNRNFYPYKLLKFLPQSDSWNSNEESLLNLEKPNLLEDNLFYSADDCLKSVLKNSQSVKTEKSQQNCPIYSVYNRDRKYSRNSKGRPDFVLQIFDVNENPSLDLSAVESFHSVQLVLAFFDSGDISFYSSSSDQIESLL